MADGARNIRQALDCFQLLIDSRVEISKCVTDEASNIHQTLTSGRDFDSYVHRIGRTGRAGRSGLATSFYVPGRAVQVDPRWSSC